MIPPLLPDDHPLLLTEMAPFVFSNDTAERAQWLVDILIEAMRHYEGSGIAANQLGLEERVFAMETEDGALVMFNPLVTWLSEECVRLDEGCLSFSDLRLKISRPKECQLRYSDVNGKTKVADFKGWEARCALHETDHLDGVTFVTRVSPLRLKMAKKKMSRIAKKP